MSDYQMWSEQPVLWWLTAVISLVLTILFYGTFPFVFSKVRKKEITKKHYRGYCICAAVAVYIFLAVGFVITETEGAPGMFPAVFWTGVFYKIGMSSLKKRGKILDSMPQETAQPVKEREPVKSTVSAVRYDGPEQKSFTAGREEGKVPDETAEAGRSAGGGTVRFCRNCGCELVPGNKFCGICGTKVVREW